MESYNYELKINPNGFNYATIKYQYFELREVLKENKSTGEYHIKLLDSSNLNKAVNKFRQILPSCKIGLVDPEMILKLEYPIYIIIKDPIIHDSFNNIMSDLDEQL